MIEGSGGGGSVKTIETDGHANLPGASAQLRPSAVRAEHGQRAGGGDGARFGCRSWRREAFGKPLLADGQGTSAVFVAGPPVVERLGEKRTKQELGGHGCRSPPARWTMRSTPKTKLSKSAQFLSYLPTRSGTCRARGSGTIPTGATSAVRSCRKPQAGVQMRKIIDMVVDRDTFSRCKRPWTSDHHRFCAVGRLAGGILAGDPLYDGGAWKQLRLARSPASSTPARPFTFPSCISSTVWASRSASPRN